MKDKISVIVPVYNVEKYLEKCIWSIINQTYSNLEIILIDDGSTDNSGKICDEFLEHDNRIKVVHKKNGGLSSARNAGLDIATGEYIGFVDSDDWIDVNMYDNLFKVAKQENSDIIECNFQKVYDGKEEEVKIYNSFVINSFNNIEALKQHLNGKYFYRCVWNKLYRRILFKDIRFPEGKVAEDLFTTHQVFYKAKIVSHVNFVGYYYYMRCDGIMDKSDFRLIKNTLEGMKEQHEFICDKIPKLKPFTDRLYMNCLLKSYSYFKSCNLEKSKEIEYYTNLVKEELERKDIVVNGVSQIAFSIYKVSPKFFSIITKKIFKYNHV